MCSVDLIEVIYPTKHYREKMIKSLVRKHDLYTEKKL